MPPGFRLVYEVRDREVLVLVVAVGKREGPTPLSWISGQATAHRVMHDKMYDRSLCMLHASLQSAIARRP